VENVPFQILCLTGGGYRGLFTVGILAKLEQEAGRPIGECFDLIAGTSIGGIVAIGLAMGRSAAEIKKVMMERGEDIFPRRWRPQYRWLRKLQTTVDHFRGPLRKSETLREVVASVVGEQTRIGDAKTRLLVPAVNMTDGKVQMFKTPHNENFVRDQHLKAVDVAMATSAAPLYFSLAQIENSLFADGGLFANAPDLCAIHEAVQFCDVDQGDIRLLSIGTTTSKCALPTSIDPRMGQSAWLENERLTTTIFSAQQQLVDFMVGHQLGGHYIRLDAMPSAEQSVDIGLDLGDSKTRGTLLGLAEGVFQTAIGNPQVRAILAHEARRMDFATRLRLVGQ
jgi:patatin-like phospholipase/acyl hydrolase